MVSRFVLAIILGALSLGSLSVAEAQNRVQRSGTVWPELQVEYVFKSTSYLYFRNQYRHNFDPDFNLLREEGPLKVLERIQFRAGFEHMFNPNWSGGLAEAYAVERTRKILFNEIFLRHLTYLGKFRFTQRASFEHIMLSNRPDFGRVRLRADLDHDFKLGARNFRPRIAYELFFNLDYTLKEQIQQNQRRVDRTRLRFEILCPLNDHLAITPFFTRQSDYLIIEPSYNAKNEIIRPGGKQNYITPIYGLDLRYAIFKGGTPFPRSIKINR